MFNIFPYFPHLWSVKNLPSNNPMEWTTQDTKHMVLNRAESSVLWLQFGPLYDLCDICSVQRMPRFIIIIFCIRIFFFLRSFVLYFFRLCFILVPFIFVEDSFSAILRANAIRMNLFYPQFLYIYSAHTSKFTILPESYKKLNMSNEHSESMCIVKDICCCCCCFCWIFFCLWISLKWNANIQQIFEIGMWHSESEKYLQIKR